MVALTSTHLWPERLMKGAALKKKKMEEEEGAALKEKKKKVINGYSLLYLIG
jgi:hypothetical protein